jgi:hypothetical protein
MRDQQAANTFSGILDGGIGSTIVGAEHSRDVQERLAIAQLLLSLRLDGTSSARETVLRIGAEHRPNERATVKPTWRVPRFVNALGAVGALLALALVVPASRAVLADQLYHLLAQFDIGSSGHLARFTPLDEAEAMRRYRELAASGRHWSFRTPYLPFGGLVPPGKSTVTQSVDSLPQLLKLTSMMLMVPRGVHRGQSVPFTRANVLPIGTVLMFFGEGANELMLLQHQLGDGIQFAVSRSMRIKGSDGKWRTEVPKLAPESIVIDGQKLVWEEDPTGMMPDSSMLVWETKVVFYTLHGRRLTRDEAIAIYKSLRVVQR